MPAARDCRPAASRPAASAACLWRWPANQLELLCTAAAGWAPARRRRRWIPLSCAAATVPHPGRWVGYHSQQLRRRPAAAQGSPACCAAAWRLQPGLLIARRAPDADTPAARDPLQSDATSRRLGTSIQRGRRLPPALYHRSPIQKLKQAGQSNTWISP